MDGWMESSGHRANILHTQLWEIGIGYYNGGSWGHYWVQDFGRRNGVFPLIINRDAASTTNKVVTIYIYNDANQPFTQMRLKNDSGAFGAWQAFQSSFAWEIACTAGSHTVTAELRTSGGAIYTSSDDITYNGSPCLPTLGGLPGSLFFMYSTASGELPVPVSLIPANTTTNDPISWSLTTSGTWFNVSPTTGTTPNTFSITPTNLGSLSPGFYEGSVTVTATSPGNTQGTPKIVTLQLTVVSGPLFFIYLPSVTR